MKTIKEQLCTLMELVPEVVQLREAYNNHLDLEADEAAPDNLSVCDASKSVAGEEIMRCGSSNRLLEPRSWKRV